MNQQPGNTKAGWERLIQAYDAMLQRVEQGLATAAAGSETALAHALEVTGIGVLRCRHCGELLHFEHTGRIPPCPRCHATVYERARE